MAQVIHQDQSGFLPTRQTKKNLRTTVNTIEYYEQHPGGKLALVFLDAEKAFDNVNWDFLKHKLEVWECGENFMKMIAAIYNEQWAK